VKIVQDSLKVTTTNSNKNSSKQATWQMYKKYCKHQFAPNKLFEKDIQWDEL